MRKGTAFFGGFATPKDQVHLDHPYFHVGNASHARVEITNIDAPSTSVQWEARRVVSPLLPSAFQRHSKLTFGEARLTVTSEGKKTVEQVRAASLFLTETLLRGSNMMQQTLWCVAAPNFDPFRLPKLTPALRQIRECVRDLRAHEVGSALGAERRSKARPINRQLPASTFSPQ